MKTFTGYGANDVYAEMVDAVMLGDVVPSRNGETREVHPAIVQLSNPRRRLVTASGRPVNVTFALSEVLWILLGRKDVEMLRAYNSRIGQWSDDGQSFNAPYGYRMRHAFGFDQLLDVIKTLKADPDSRQAIINVWNPSNDRGWKMEEKHVTADRACNVMAHAMIRGGKLDWLQIVRSNDLLWGVPYNWMQWTHVQEYVANQVGVPLGKYIHVADSLHVYDYHWDEAQQIEEFDLYNYLGDHEPMGVLNGPALTVIGSLEDSVRKTDPVDAIAYLSRALHERSDSIPLYWQQVLYQFLAHALYKKDRDETALEILMTECDPVYAMAQIRFYLAHRWHKDGFEEIRNNIDSSFIRNHPEAKELRAWLGI